MQRIDTSTKAVDLFGSGKHGFQDGNPSLGVAATQLNAALFNNVQEEIARVVEAAGITLNGSTYDQLLGAIPKVTLGGSVQSWQSVTRLSGTTYYNTTGRAIVLRIYETSSTGLQVGTTISINGGLAIQLAAAQAQSGVAVYAIGSIIIPVDASYVLTDFNVAARSNWELR